MTVLISQPSFSDIDTASLAVSPSAVVATLMTQ